RVGTCDDGEALIIQEGERAFRQRIGDAARDARAHCGHSDARLHADLAAVEFVCAHHPSQIELRPGGVRCARSPKFRAGGAGSMTGGFSAPLSARVKATSALGTVVLVGEFVLMLTLVAVVPEKIAWLLETVAAGIVGLLGVLALTAVRGYRF